MSFSQVIFKISFKQLLKEKWQLLMWILIPLMIGGLFSLMVGSGGQPKPVGTLLITDNDKTFLSQFITRGFQQGPMAEMFILKNSNSDQAHELMSKGKASAWIEIEKGFADKFLNNQPTTIKLVKNPGQNILPEIAQTAVTVMADGGHYIQQLFAGELAEFNSLLSGKGISDTQVALMSVKIKATIESLEKQLFPPQIKAVKKTEEDKKDKPSSSFILYLFPGIMFMSLLFAAQGLALDFWKDKTQGILTRLLASPAGMSHYLNGKLIYSASVFVIISIVIGVLGLLMLEVALDRIFIIVAWLLLSGLVLWSLMLFISLLLPTKKAANIVTQAMVFPLMMLGGSFFPFEAMPKWMVAIGQWLPNGYLLQSFKLWFIDNQNLQVLLTPALIGFSFIIIMWLINKSILTQFARD
jgi:ABC-type multidrug transport system permease subunit